MPFRFLATLILLGAIASSQTSNTTVPTVVPVPVSPVYVTPAYPGAYGGYILTTPTVAFPSPQPTSGISLEGRSGISLNQPSSATAASVGTQESTGATEETAAVSGRQVSDLGPSYYSAAPVTAKAMTVAQVAAQYRGQQLAKNAHVYTNTDLARLVAPNNRIIVAGSTYTLAQPVAENPATPLPRSQTTTREPTQLESQGSEQTARIVLAPHPQSENTSAESRKSESRREPQRLPASSSLLPLLGVAGIVSGCIGLLFRAFQRA
ncbi:MAG TPA: hypothetical protein VKZ53_10880 [Candidatus Angelobacter sp.]|nr:hypothetical protein [Candidatus Angelobacter sp.]